MMKKLEKVLGVRKYNENKNPAQEKRRPTETIKIWSGQLSFDEPSVIQEVNVPWINISILGHLHRFITAYIAEYSKNLEKNISFYDMLVYIDGEPIVLEIQKSYYFKAQIFIHRYPLPSTIKRLKKIRRVL